MRADELKKMYSGIGQLCEIADERYGEKAIGEFADYFNEKGAGAMVRVVDSLSTPRKMYKALASGIIDTLSVCSDKEACSKLRSLNHVLMGSSIGRVNDMLDDDDMEDDDFGGFEDEFNETQAEIVANRYVSIYEMDDGTAMMFSNYGNIEFDSYDDAIDYLFDGGDNRIADKGNKVKDDNTEVDIDGKKVVGRTFATAQEASDFIAQNEGYKVIQVNEDGSVVVGLASEIE